MSVLRSEHRPHWPALRSLPPHLGVVATVASVLLLVLSVPPPLALPALSFASFVAAVIVALIAWWSRTDRRAEGLTLWDIAGIFALLWIVTGMLSGPEQMVQMFGPVTAAR